MTTNQNENIKQSELAYGQLLKKDLRDSMNILLNLQEREEAIYDDIDEKKKNKNFCKKRLSRLTKRCEYLGDEIMENQKIVKTNKRKVAKWEEDQKKKRKKKNNKNINQLVSEIVTPLAAQSQPRRAVRAITETTATSSTATSNAATSTAVSSTQDTLNVTSPDSDSESVEVTESQTITLDDSPGEAIIRKGKQLIQSSSDDDSDAFSYN